MYPNPEPDDVAYAAAEQVSNWTYDRDLTEPDEVDADLCGWTYDHKLDLMGERDRIRTYTCRECGAEIIEEDE